MIVTRFFLVPACQELNERSTTSTMTEIPSPIPLPFLLSCRSGQHPWQPLFEAEIKVCAALHSNISQHHRNYFTRHPPPATCRKDVTGDAVIDVTITCPFVFGFSYSCGWSHCDCPEWHIFRPLSSNFQPGPVSWRAICPRHWRTKSFPCPTGSQWNLNRRMLSKAIWEYMSWLYPSCGCSVWYERELLEYQYYKACWIGGGPEITSRTLDPRRQVSFHCLYLLSFIRHSHHVIYQEDWYFIP